MAEKIKRDPDLSLFVNRHDPVRVDEKGRIVLQKEIRDALGSDVMLVCDVSRVMRMYPKSVFDKKQKEEHQRFSDDNISANYYFQAIYSNGRAVEIDSANRISIPTDLRTFTGIDLKQECVIIASRREFLVLPRKAYDEYIRSPIKFHAKERDEIAQLRFKAFEEEKELMNLERRSVN